MVSHKVIGMPNNNKSNWFLRCSHLPILKLVAFTFLYLSGTALAADTQCKPDTVMSSGFENELPLLFEDTFEGCRSRLWRELSGNWQVTDGAYFTTLDSPANLLPLEPNNFIIEAEMSSILGGGFGFFVGNSLGGKAASEANVC